MALFNTYKEKIIPQLLTSRGYKNVNEVPKLEKVVINTGISRSKDREVFTEATQLLADITGQKPVTTLARKSVSNFKLRENDPVGVKVTLRGKRMYDFVERLVNVALPRVRDFRGTSVKAFDGAGNYTLGITEQTIFTEVNVDRMKHTIGMDITFVTTAKTDEECREMLALMGMPFAK